jgi:CheY-like chemotaxis protein
MDRIALQKALSDKIILFVDDDEAFLDVAKRIYGRYFKNVLFALDGLNGLEIYKNYQPDIIVSDVTMPICNGIEMATELQKIDANLKIIFATGHNEKEYLEQLEIFGGNVITKPIKMEELFEKILYALNKN